MSTSAIVLVVTLAVAAHVLLVLAAGRWNVLFLIAGAYCVLAPISGAEDFQFVSVAKLGRAYCTILLCVVGLAFVRKSRPGWAGVAYGLFVLSYLAAGFYSYSPLGALQFKGLYALVALSGLLMAYSLRSLRDLEHGMRVLALASITFGVALSVEVLLNPTAISTAARLQPWGLNANRIGHEAASFLAVNLALALYDTSRAWRLVGFVAAFAFALVVLASGSRASLGLAAVASIIMLLPMTGRPVLLVAILSLISIAVPVAREYLEPEVAQRLSDLSVNDRMRIWNYALDRFEESPVTGEGWLFEHRESRPLGSPINTHNMYLQVLAEGGIVGASFLLLAILVVQVRSLRVLVALRRTRETSHQYAYFPLAILTALAVHGIAESSTIQGSSVVSLLLPFGVGLIDQCHRFIAAPDAQQPRARGVGPLLWESGAQGRAAP